MTATPHPESTGPVRYVQHPSFPNIVREVTGGSDGDLKHWTDQGWVAVKKEDEAKVLASAAEPKA
jgi:hypothetical protein